MQLYVPKGPKGQVRKRTLPFEMDGSGKPNKRYAIGPEPTECPSGLEKHPVLKAWLDDGLVCEWGKAPKAPSKPEPKGKGKGKDK